MKSGKLFLVALVVCATAWTFAQSPVLVQGQPPLTEETVGRFTEFFEWAFDVHLTNEQRLVLRKYTVDSWTQKKQSDMNDVVQLVQQQIELSKLDAQQRGYVRVKIEPELLDQMRKQPNEPMARWALAVYESSHRVIAQGSPPLTRQGTDAFLESLFFEAGVVTGVQVAPDQALKDDWARGLAANYPKMSVELKQQIAAMPLYMATMRMSWPQLSESVKAQYRAQWTEQFKALLPAQAPAQAQAAAPQGNGGSPARGTSRGSETVAQMMAEQNRRHEAYMSMSNLQMQSFQSNLNNMNTMSGNPYRYW